MKHGWLALLVLHEWRHHPWRHAVALLAVALGVALAYSVHLINSSALAEFSAAVRSTGGEPDLSLRAGAERLPDALFDRAEADPAVLHASPVLDIDSSALGRDGQRVALRVIGIDALRVAPLAPALLPLPAAGEDRLARLDPDLVFANAAARKALGAADGATLQLQAGNSSVALRLAGSSAAGGMPTLVMDIAGAQAHFRAGARLSRIDLRLVPGAGRDALIQRLALPPGVLPVAPDDAEQRLSALSRAYRVNLTVLALVALFVGAFLVFSVVSLSVAQRTPALALLGVLGLTPVQRRALVLAECALLGAGGSAIGLALGTALAWAALRLLAGDLGGGYFPGIVPALHWHAGSAAVFGALGVLSALAGGWWPARQAQAIAPAQALKGLGHADTRAPPAWPGITLMALGAAAAWAPPVFELPLAAYASVAALLFGGVVLVPAAVHALLAAMPKAHGALALLAVERARFQRRTATAAVAGVVASLALCVALTVMVGSFRAGVTSWLDAVLPAELYVRGAAGAPLPGDLAERAAALPGVMRVQASRARPLLLAPDLPQVTLIARPLDDTALPLVAPALPPRAGEVGVFVSEAIVDLYGARPGTLLALPLAGRSVPVRVRGVWRDYARQFGAIAMPAADYRALTGDVRVDDVAVWLAPGADAGALQDALRALLPDPTLIELASAATLRAMSLRIFDRSFAVTHYLQAVAIAIGLVGIAASLSAQVLARRKEFGLLAHLGLTRRQIVGVVAGEGLAWVAAGTAVGLVLGVAVSVVLVHVVNPQSFHWTMDLVLPWPRLAALCAAVLAAGTATAAFSARHAASRAAVLAVKEDW